MVWDCPEDMTQTKNAPVPIHQSPYGDDQAEFCDPQYQRPHLEQGVQAG